ncbi:MAG: filamentous hemagglutinin N-terminal domain-containing protein [Candidatus Omnitrophota bacterium]
MNNIKYSSKWRWTSKLMALILAMTVSSSQILLAQEIPVTDQLPVGGHVTAGAAGISQIGANMNIDQSSQRAVIDWQSFNIGSNANVNFNQPSIGSVALNRVLDGNPTQIFGRLTANGQVFLTNGAGVYFAPDASVNVGSFLATNAAISNEDFMAGRYVFNRNGATGGVINEGSIKAGLGGYVALLAPEVRNEGVAVAQMGTVALAAGEAYELQFDNQGGLADITVSKSDIAALVENKQAIEAPGGLIILSAQAANYLQGGVVKNSGTIEASGMVNDGGVVRLVASDNIELSGEIITDAAANSSGNGGKVTAVADLENMDSSLIFSGKISAKGGDNGGDGGSVETSGSHFYLKDTSSVTTSAKAGKTGHWLIDPYDYNIDAAAAASIVTSLSGSNVEVTTLSNNVSQGSNGNSSSTGNITVSSAISSASANALTLTASNAVIVSAGISTGALTLTGPGGITLNNSLSTLTDMTINGNVILGADVILTSGISNTYTAYTTYVVPAGITSLTATLVGGSGGKGGTDTSTGGDAGTVGVLTASFDVTAGESIYIAPGSAGVHGGDQTTNTGGSAGGTNQFALGNGGAGGDTGPSGNSGGGAGGGAATILALTNAPTTASAMLLAGGGGGGGGSGNNTACPDLCGDQSSINYRTDNSMIGQRGYHAGNQANPIDDGGGSGGGGGGLTGGKSNESVFYVNEWTGRGGNVGESGAANGFSTTSLSTSLTNLGNSINGYAIISYGGGTINISGSVNGAHALTVVARSSDVNISGSMGGSIALTSLDITGSSGITLSGGAVTTTGAQSYTGPLILNANTTTITTTANGAVTFAGDVVKSSGNASNLAVSSGSGHVSFNGKAGTSSSSMGALSVTGTGTTSFAGVVYASSLAKLGSGKTVVSGGTVQTGSGQSYAGMLDLGGNATLTNTGAGDITLSGAVSNNTQRDLTINASNGNVTIAGNLAVGTNDRPTPIGNVSITASGTVTLGSSGASISGDAKSLSITANNTNVYANTVSSFTCGTGSAAVGICLTDTASFNISAASVFSGPLAGTTSLTKSGTGSLSMGGVNTYTGNTTINAGKLDITGTGKLGNGNYAGNILVNGQLRFSNSVAQILGGAISGTGFINSPGSGVTDITTLAHADHYNLANAYVVPTGSGNSSIYGDTSSFSYQLATTAGGGTEISDADPSGDAVLSGTPSVTSSIGGYTIAYASGLSLGSERYTLVAGNALSWTVNPRPLTVTVSKIYDGSASFLSGFILSGTVNNDATPTLTGSASVSSRNTGSYTSFSGSTLSLNNSNYTLTGATINATISQQVLNLTVSKTYDGGPSFARDFQLSGMVAGDSAPAITGTASVGNSTAGTYTGFVSSALSLEDTNYTLNGGTVSALILPESQRVPVAVIPQIMTPGPDSSAPALTLPETNAPVIVENSSPVLVVVDNVPQGNGGNSSGTQNSVAAGASSPSTNSSQRAVVVSLVQEPSAQTSGIVNVSVPQEVISSTGGFSFQLPQIITGSHASEMISVTARRPDGRPLPAWLHFDSMSKTFSVTAVPAGVLPFQVSVMVRSADGRTVQTTIISISSQNK